MYLFPGTFFSSTAALVNTESLDLEASSSQYADIADGSQTGLDMGASQDFTVELWVKPESFGTFNYILSKGDTGASEKWYGFFVNTGGSNEVVWNIDDGTTRYNVIGSTALSTGTWTHIAGVRSGTTMELFINGVSDGSTSDANIANDLGNTYEFALGRRSSAASLDRYFDGLIDDVRVWSTARNAATIAGEKDMELLGNETNLQGYWRLNNDYTDATSNGNDLTASGSPVFSSDVAF